MNALRIGAVAIILILMGYVVLNPSQAYGAVPRLMLFLLASASIAILLGAEASTRLDLKFQGFAFVTAGTAALAFALFWFLTGTLKPDLQVAIYQIQDEFGSNLRVDVPDAVTVHEIPSGRPGFFVAQGNYLVVTFADLVPEQELKIRKTTDSNYYRGTISYAGTRQATLRLGKDLVR